MTTSDERREVAAKLRAFVPEINGTNDFAMYLNHWIGVGNANVGDSVFSVKSDRRTAEMTLEKLADLIDPTCGEWRDYPHPVDPAGFIEDDSELWCEHCDIPLDPDYRYCPYCGSRVVSGLDAHVDGC